MQAELECGDSNRIDNEAPVGCAAEPAPNAEKDHGWCAFAR
jgi:hypothetical protein